MALGQVDYGLNGLVGGLTVYITFFNGILASSNSRFYAFSVGAAKVAEDQSAGLEECRRWFNTAFSVHTVLPLMLIAIGYPLGSYAILHWLTIPADRVNACIWVFRFVCVSCFVGMINVPFSAMYGAKQYIAELTIYSFVTSTMNVFVLYYMINHPGDWLAKFAAWSCLLSVVPQCIICCRAIVIFPECRIRIRYMWDRSRIKRLGVYSFWQFLGCLCGMLRYNGIAIVVNKFFGPAMNAAQAIGSTVQGHCTSLAGSMQGAFTPIITQACGARDFVKMRSFAMRTCKFNVVLTAIFTIPLVLELPEVMRLWLKTPPAYSVGLCLCAMIMNFVNSCTTGHMVAINATGRIAAYHAVLGAISILTLPLAIVTGFVWRNIYVVVSTVIFMESLNSIGRIVFARILVGMSVRVWVLRVFVPAVCAIAFCLFVGYLPHFFFSASFGRVVITTCCVEIVYLPLVWFVLLSSEERAFVLDRVRPRLSRLLGVRK